MIQDIHPHKLHNEFIPGRPLDDDGLLFVFRGPEVLCRVAGDVVVLPRVREIVEELFENSQAPTTKFKNDDTMKPEANFPPPEKQDDSQIFSGDDFWVSGYCSDAPEATGAGVTKLTFFVNTDSLEPHDDISIRYYFSIEEFNTKEIPGSFVLQKTYDQVETEVADKSATLSQPKHYKDDIWYIEISWYGYAIANSNKKYQLIIGNYFGENWDSSNDWSKKGMVDLTKEGEVYDNIVGGVEFAKRCENVCVYADGKLLGGTEPDGTQPAKVYKVSHLVRLSQMLLGQSPFSSKEVADQFDFNSDGRVDTFDLVLLRKLVISSNNL